MVEKAPGSPKAGVFAETAAFVRKKVEAGEMSAEEGLRLTERAYRDSMITQELGFPVETDRAYAVTS